MSNYNSSYPAGTTADDIDAYWGDPPFCGEHADYMQIDENGDYYCPRCRELEPEAAQPSKEANS